MSETKRKRWETMRERWGRGSVGSRDRVRRKTKEIKGETKNKVLGGGGG